MSLVALDRTISASQLSTRASLSYKSRRATARGHGGWAVCGCGRRWGAKAWSDAVTGLSAPTTCTSSAARTACPTGSRDSSTPTAAVQVHEPGAVIFGDPLCSASLDIAVTLRQENGVTIIAAGQAGGRRSGKSVRGGWRRSRRRGWGSAPGDDRTRLVGRPGRDGALRRSRRSRSPGFASHVPWRQAWRTRARRRSEPLRDR